MSRSRALDGHLAPITTVLAAAPIFGTTGTSQALGPPDATSLAIGAVRLVVGAAALAAIAWLRRPGAVRAWRHHAPTLLLGGVAVALYQLGWFAGLRRTGVAVGTVVGIGSGPVMAGLIHLARGRRGLTSGWVVGTATVLGAGLLAARGAGPSSADPVGLVLALGAVLGYALYVEAAQHAIRGGLDAAGAMAGMFGVGARAARLAGEPAGRGHGLHLGVITIGVAYTLYGWGFAASPYPRWSH
jgi:DME family drug/metabolite transporter